MAEKIPRMLSAITEMAGNAGERTVIFFDAVTAIAITLLVLEIPLPETGFFGLGQLEDLFAPFTAFFISFIVLGQVWYIHARTFSYEGFVRHCSIPDHLALMFLVILFPKTTELISLHPDSIFAVVVYLLCYVALVGIEGIMIVRSYMRQMRSFERVLAAQYGVSLQRKNIVEAVRALTEVCPESAALSDALRRLFSIELGTLILSVAATVGSVLALFLYPLACYVFFAVDIALSLALSRRAERYRDIVVTTLDRRREAEDFEQAASEVV